MSWSRSRVRFKTPAARRVLTGVAALALATPLAACQGSDTGPGAVAPAAGSGTGSAAPAAAVDPVRIHLNVKRGATDVPVDRILEVSATGGSLDSVQVSSHAGDLPGTLSQDGSSWTAGARLEPGRRYVVTSVAHRSDGQQVTRKAHFRAQDLTLDQQTYASVAPLEGETVGVGMPVIVTFDVPVTDKASIEKHMSVSASPRQPGSWHWISDTEVHWRPRTYWKAGSDVSVNVDVNSVPAGAGIYGQEDRHVDFHIGDAHVYKVNLQTDELRAFSNGKLLRTIPVTAGKDGFTTRSGTKVIIEKFKSKRMDSETIGIGKNSPEYYNLADVKYAMRLTYSGEFLHAAPWSVASQGYDNVSHGCTGMSTENAKWLFDLSRRGDVVEYTGTDRPMTLTNGYGDWNESYSEWKQGSALA
ncbi:L,D-transpeptidase [Nocardioides panaciterrulae]|uniref:Lipoprotein-anchoring transpeptidase ErfK/SrfK n=1 Tax=Nocardioides panaciterrulae TaxID=661492 RepID=A0A7Y9JCJ8_9ACTN|nr:Ig-like domain-containing protein [Nocardioides panaciterrulae]NYD42324.1 lipoprotein-anchoring transpeptidase ErfK/SrfK [Nocardioides panaciterrulae]